ncbi:MAG: amidohydrolase family protein [bacterium]
MRQNLLLISFFLLLGFGLSAQWENGILLSGKICTMNDSLEVIEQGRLLIKPDGTILLLTSGQNLPDDCAEAIQIETGGVIYPGLIDMHNHPAYNVFPIWPVPKQYTSRYQWPSHSSYKELVRGRYNYLYREKKQKTNMGIYAEVKSMAGGTTAIQGLPANRIYGKYMVRNIEQKNFGQDRIGANVMKMSRSSSNFERTKENLDGKLDGWFYHLAEGSDPGLMDELYDLCEFGFNLEPIIAIHCCALDSAACALLDSVNMKMVWSPLSNLLLYGQTARVDIAKRAGIMIGLGSDWSLSGSKNILWELKVAALWNKTQLGNLFTPKELVHMVTLDAARILKWDDKVGSIQNGMIADLVVTADKVNDPYENLILCTEEDINLVLVGGEPFYGNKQWMKQLKRIGRKYDFDVIDKKFPGDKGIDITRPGLQDMEYEDMYGILETEMLSDSFPVAPVEPDPIYTSLDPEFFRLIWAVPHNPLDVSKLAAFVHPLARANEETALRERPRSPIITKLSVGQEVIIVKEASGRRRNWHEVLMKDEKGTVYHGVVRKDDLDIVMTPEQFGEWLFGIWNEE